MAIQVLSVLRRLSFGRLKDCGNTSAFGSEATKLWTTERLQQYVWFHICYYFGPRGYFLSLYTGVCVWRVKFKPQNMDSLKIFHPKILESCISPTQKYGSKLCFRHKFDGKRLFLMYYRIEWRKYDSY